MINTELRCKTCRREGKKLFLKGERCSTSKCALVKRKYPPGMHGPKGYPRLSDYGRQLRAKQQLRKSYGISEKQLVNYYTKAKSMKGNTEEIFLSLLEKRLDNVVFRAGFANSRKKARQLIGHGNILVNSRRVDIPSYLVKVGDEIKPKPKKNILQQVEEQLTQNQGNKNLIPSWVSLDFKKAEIKVLKEVFSEDLPQEFEIEMIIGYYSR